MVEHNEESRRLFMEKNGVLKELNVNLLPNEVVELLDREFDKSKVVGIGRFTCERMAESSKEQLSEYWNEGKKSVRSFESIFDIHRNMKLMVDALELVSHLVVKYGFTSKDINEKLLSESLGVSYSSLYRAYNEWIYNPFYGLKAVSVIKFFKFYSIVVGYENRVKVEENKIAC